MPKKPEAATVDQPVIEKENPDMTDTNTEAATAPAAAAPQPTAAQLWDIKRAASREAVENLVTAGNTAVSKAIGDYRQNGYNPLTNPPIRQPDADGNASSNGFFKVWLTDATENIAAGKYSQCEIGDGLVFAYDCRGFLPIYRTNQPQNKANIEKAFDVWRSVGIVIADALNSPDSIEWIGTGEHTDLYEAVNNIFRNTGANAGAEGRALVSGDSTSRMALEVKVRKEVTDTTAAMGLDIADPAIQAMIEKAVATKMAKAEADKAAKAAKTTVKAAADSPAADTDSELKTLDAEAAAAADAAAEAIEREKENEGR